MKETLERVFPGPGEPPAVPRRRATVAPAWIMALIACMAAAGCSPRIVRVPVSGEDMVRANHLVREGNGAYSDGDYYYALIRYLKAAELNPNSDYISNRLGMAYLQLDYYDRAIAAFERSIALNSKYAFSVNNLGSAHFAGGNFKKAEKFFKKAIKMKNDEASFHLNLGTVYFEKKKPEKALEEWQRGLALDPDILSRDDSITVAIAGGGIPPKDRNYFMARIYAAAGDIPRTIESLKNALMNGFHDIERIENSPEFDSIRGDARFVEFMEDASVWAGADYPEAVLPQ
ncbi:MAG: tetratricopeptide repeat protein [Acidobacteria bacterium]|nr:tetratricopeptide repeat protein [Acidobacteriota bacterium]